MKISSDAVRNGCLDLVYGINSPNEEEIIAGIPQRSFPITWGEVPENTQSFALVFEDFDNIEDEGVHWIHWIVADIDKNKRMLEENAANNEALIQGKTGWAIPYAPYDNIPEELISKYGGPASWRRHEYELTLYALDCELKLKRGFTYNVMRKLMKDHILDQATLKLYYGENHG